MKNILAVMGSPRKGGNTEILLSRLAEGAKSKGARVEMIRLAELNIRECDGCHACWKGKDCCKKDDMLGLYEKIIECDCIVFGTPVYWFGPTAIMKAFIDRFVFFNCPENRAKIKGKLAALIVPFEDETIETARPLIELFNKSLDYLEMKLTGSVIAGGAGDRGAILKKPERLNEAYELGMRLAAD